MIRSKNKNCSGLSAFLFAALVVMPAQAPQAEEILVGSAISLTDALTEIGKAYEQKSQHTVIFSFAASSDLARQIFEGAPLDLFFSADPEKIAFLAGKGLIVEGSVKTVLSNQLVIVARRDSRLQIRSPQDLLQTRVKIFALAEPSTVPAGIYAKKYLLEQGIWEKIHPRIVPTLDVRAALASVAAGNADAGMVYKTDAAISPAVKILYEVPPGQGPQIVYPLALIKKPKQKQAARDFARFILSDAGKGVFKNYGFVVLQ